MAFNPFQQNDGGAGRAYIEALADRQQRTDSLSIPQQLQNFGIGQTLDAFRGMNGLGQQIGNAFAGVNAQNLQAKQFTDSLNLQLQLEQMRQSGQSERTTTAFGSIFGDGGGGFTEGGGFIGGGDGGGVPGQAGTGGLPQTGITPFGGFASQLENGNNVFENLKNAQLPDAAGGIQGAVAQQQFGNLVGAQGDREQGALERFSEESGKRQQLASEEALAHAGVGRRNLDLDDRGRRIRRQSAFQNAGIGLARAVA